MYKTVNLTLTEADCLNMRLALNAAAIHWGEKATDYRKAGNDHEAATCERIRTEFHQLWDAVNVAQEAAPELGESNAKRRDPLRSLYDRQSVARYGS
jgi:hypothetical protein